MARNETSEWNNDSIEQRALLLKSEASILERGAGDRNSSFPLRSFSSDHGICLG